LQYNIKKDGSVSVTDEGLSAMHRNDSDKTPIPSFGIMSDMEYHPAKSISNLTAD
jgi:hypothetical protein